MKSCPQCQRTFPNDAGFCAADGSALVLTSLVPVAKGDDPRIGRRLCGRYELRRVVADGGMGRVYEGVDKQTDTRIAVKVLHSDVAKDDVALERFRREYAFSSKLPHDHIVQVLDFQKDDSFNEWILVMEFLDGEELRLILKREKTIPVERIVRMIAHVAIGLDAAHAAQIVHRDLKPDNLFLCGTRDGDITKILDFGSVKDKNQDAKKLTVMGTTIGSPYYMAPEQAQGLETLDARADVFAVAAITYECVTGKVPFPGSNGPSILLAILTKDAVPPSELTSGATPPKLDEVFEEALAKNPAIRTKSVNAFVNAFGQAYGLEGDYQSWAKMTLTELAGAVEAGKGRVASAAAVVEADPFAAPAPAHGVAAPSAGGSGYGQPAQGAYGAPAPQPMVAPGVSASRAMDQAFEASRAAQYAAPPGLPVSKTPAWLIPAVVGGVIVVGVIIAIVATR